MPCLTPSTILMVKNMAKKSFFGSLAKRLRALGDKSAWLLIVPACALLYYIDTAMTKTLVQWLIFAPVFAGVAIVVSRFVFPQINLTNLIDEAERGNVAAGIVVAGLLVFVAMVLQALVGWARV